MKNLLSFLSVLAFALLGTALACPKTGGIMNGAAPRPAGLTAECGVAWTAFKGSLNRNASTPFTFAELYVIPSASAGRIGGQIEDRIEALGYTKVMSKAMDNGHQFGFVNVRTGRLVIVQVMAIAGKLYMSLLGGKS